MDTLEVPELGAIEASIVDAANPIVFVRAAELGITGVEYPVDLEQDPEAIARLERIRCAGPLPQEWPRRSSRLPPSARRALPSCW